MHTTQCDQSYEAATELKKLLNSGFYNNPSVVRFLDRFLASNAPEDGDEDVVLLKYHLLDALRYLSGRLRVDDSPVVLKHQKGLLQALLNFHDMQAVVARHYPVLYEPRSEESDDDTPDSWSRLLRLLSASLQISG